MNWAVMFTGAHNRNAVKRSYPEVSYDHDSPYLDDPGHSSSESTESATKWSVRSFFVTLMYS